METAAINESKMKISITIWGQAALMFSKEKNNMYSSILTLDESKFGPVN